MILMTVLVGFRFIDTVIFSKNPDPTADPPEEALAKCL